MPFSIAPAGEIFQSRLDQAMEGLDDVKTVADDIPAIGNGCSMSEAIADHDRKPDISFDSLQRTENQAESSQD